MSSERIIYECQYCAHTWKETLNVYGWVSPNLDTCDRCGTKGARAQRYEHLDTYRPAPEAEKIDYYAPHPERKRR